MNRQRIKIRKAAAFKMAVTMKLNYVKWIAYQNIDVSPPLLEIVKIKRVDVNERIVRAKFNERSLFGCFDLGRDALPILIDVSIANLLSQFLQSIHRPERTTRLNFDALS